ncbi:hypothetical protein NP233_g7006 [Leucocoprinus birnbaumii]|uniref:Nephrocystin 3-like N-terminal domain-containing protein n=1 Tax=Leucocoprinus birnbaumii TaxID=56174 RepID=A0AAD5VSF3_9AGAR|nr:hypothetical protein NP233_g7006 [Leucocoprinus birnbaumii]
MSFFSNAHDFQVHGSSFYSYSTKYELHGSASTGIDILLQASTPEATVDSQERYNRTCFPGTREQYISDITNWAAAPSSAASAPIYWMKGPAGVGKSAIAQTCAETLKSKGHLGASYFFTSKKYDNPARLFTTIAYQLTTILPEYRDLLDERVFRDKTIVEKSMSSQFHFLIAEPLEELRRLRKPIPRVSVIIDGLDECADESAQVEIIETIAYSIRTGSTPFRWAIFSREEPQITSTFTASNVRFYCHSVFLPVSREIDREIELYLRGGFQNILQRRNLLNLSSSWPTDCDIKRLVNAAAGLFAYPAIVMRFVDTHSLAGFQDTLQSVLASISVPCSQGLNPFYELDRLYYHILQCVPKEIFPSVQLFLAYMASIRNFGPGQHVAILWCHIIPAAIRALN